MADVVTRSKELTLKLYYNIGSSRTINVDSPIDELTEENIKTFYDAASSTGVIANTSGITDTTAVSAYITEKARYSLDLS